ncbi:MAG: hypothetical protein AAB131_02185 [Actinomycetota bacterium]
MPEQPFQESNNIDLRRAQLEVVPQGQPDVSVVIQLDRIRVGPAH